MTEEVSELTPAEMALLMPCRLPNITTEYRTIQPGS